ncbi:uncharacterized protein LOC128832547 [Malaclemys terrapin pileata]|uniref:uncharacterized protein LOC128832547 n=1 Tax=Malaclemys terrapin pileata TaxID=2991368 RepID=UPI0023A8AFE7|nr:uncharacterized protein LOC128832547 [Malaclemys terrapin pileata]
MRKRRKKKTEQTKRMERGKKKLGENEGNKENYFFINVTQTRPNPSDFLCRQKSLINLQNQSHNIEDATLRSQPSVLSPAKRLQRIRKRPCKSKEDMLHVVMQQSLNKNLKAQKWKETERRIRQQNEEHRHKSTELWQQSTDRLISIMECQADSIQELVVMQVEHYRDTHTPRALVPKLFPLGPHVTSNPLSPTSGFLSPPAASNTCSFTTQP